MGRVIEGYCACRVVELPASLAWAGWQGKRGKGVGGDG